MYLDLIHVLYFVLKNVFISLFQPSKYNLYLSEQYNKIDWKIRDKIGLQYPPMKIRKL